MKNDKIKGNPFAAMGKGLVLAYCFTFVVLLIMALLVTYTGLTEEHTSAIALAVMIISVFLCGYKTAKAANSRGWLWGIISGIIYVGIMILIGFLGTESYTFGTKTLVMLAMALAGGGLGGILGINRG